MNTQRNLTILLIICTSLILRGDGCNVLEQRDIEQVTGLPIPAEWESIGYTDANFQDSQTVNVATDVRDALAGQDVSKVVSLGVSGVQYKVLDSTGHDAQRQGYANIDGQRIIDFDVPTNVTGTEGAAGDGSGTLTMFAAGTTYVTAQLNTWLTQYKADPASADDSLLEFTYDVEWNSTPAPTAMDPDNFRWTTDLVIQLVVVITVPED